MKAEASVVNPKFTEFAKGLIPPLLTSDQFNEAFVKDVILKYPGTKRLAIDIGAEHGRHVEHMVEHGFKDIWAFEPAPYNMKHLEDKHWPNVRLFKEAVGTPYGMRLWLSPWTVGHTTNEEIAGKVWPDNPGWKFGGEFIDVPSMTMDQVWGTAHAEQKQIGLIKCDIEGGELTAFKHAEALLEDNRKWLVIVLEVHRGVDLKALFNCLAVCGYNWYDDKFKRVHELAAGRHYMVTAS